MYEHEVDEADIEAIGDEALRMEGEDPPAPAVRRRAMSVGARLTARQVVGDRRRAVFIQNLAQHGVVGRAAAAAGWPSSTAYALRKSDPEFARLWEEAVEFAADALEAAARERAVDGVLRPVYQQGALVGHVREYSDRLLELMLRAKRPEYRERRDVDVGFKGGVLVVPGQSPESDWEAAAAAQQAPGRANRGELVGPGIIEGEAIDVTPARTQEATG